MTSAQIGLAIAISLGAMLITLGVKRVSKTRTVLTVLAGLARSTAANIGLLGSGLKLLLGTLLRTKFDAVLHLEIHRVGEEIIRDVRRGLHRGEVAAVNACQ